eukprot:RCo037903
MASSRSGTLVVTVGTATELPPGFSGFITARLGDMQMSTTTRTGHPSVTWNERLMLPATLEVIPGPTVLLLKLPMLSITTGALPTQATERRLLDLPPRLTPGRKENLRVTFPSGAVVSVECEVVEGRIPSSVESSPSRPFESFAPKASLPSAGFGVSPSSSVSQPPVPEPRAAGLGEYSFPPAEPPKPSPPSESPQLSLLPGVPAPIPSPVEEPPVSSLALSLAGLPVAKVVSPVTAARQFPLSGSTRAAAPGEFASAKTVPSFSTTSPEMFKSSPVPSGGTTPTSSTVEALLTQLATPLTQHQLWDLHLYLLQLDSELTPAAMEWARTFMTPFTAPFGQCGQHVAWQKLLGMLLRCMRSVLNQVEDRLAKVQGECTKIETEKRAARAQVSDLEAQLRQIAERPVMESETLREELQRLRFQNAELQMQLQAATEGNFTEQVLKDNFVDGLKGGAVHLRAALQKESNAVVDLEQQLASAGMENEKLNNQLLAERLKAQQALVDLEQERARTEGLEHRLRLVTSTQQEFAAQKDDATAELARLQARVEYLEQQLKLVQDKARETTESSRGEIARHRGRAEYLEQQLKAVEDVKDELTRERVRAEHLDVQLKRLEDAPFALETLKAELIQERARANHLQWELRVLQEQRGLQASEAQQSLQAEMLKLRQANAELTAQLQVASRYGSGSAEELTAARAELLAQKARVERLEQEAQALQTRPTEQELAAERARAE